MSWRLAVEHRTGYRYQGEVHASYNEARITPSRSGTQLVLEHHVEVRPRVPVMRYVDYWGTEVAVFDVHEPHEELVVIGKSLVETQAEPPLVSEVTWDELFDDALRDRFCEHLLPTDFAPAAEELVDLGRSTRALATPLDAALAIVEEVRRRMAYESGATSVSTSAAEALHLGRGVCQDFVHVSLAALRAAGIPARYASGYLHTHPEAALGETVTGESHAWFEAWLGEWRAFDPTNGAPVAERHVLVARGRDYADVPPLKGVYHGPPGDAVAVTVGITRVA